MNNRDFGHKFMHGESYVSTNLAIIQSTFELSSKCTELIETKSSICLQLQRQWFFCFQEQVPLYNPHFSTILFTAGQSEHSSSSTEATPLSNLEKLVFFPPRFPKVLSACSSFHSIFPNLMRNLMHKCSSSLLSSIYTKLTMEQHTFVLGKTLLNNHKYYSPTTYEMAQQTLHFMVNVHASSCSVILWSVQKPSDYTIYSCHLYREPH